MDREKINVMERVNAIKVYVPAAELDDLIAGCNYEAVGDGVLLVDTDQLDNATSSVAGDVLAALPDDYTGLVYIVC